MTGAIGRALFVVTTIFSLVFSMPLSVIAQTEAANANAQCPSGDYSCDWPTKRTVGTGQYATQVQCMRNKPCTETKSNTTGKCARFEFCTASSQTDKDLTGKPSGWTGEGDTQPSTPQIPSVPTSPAPAAPAPTSPSTQPPAADPTKAFQDPKKTPDPAKQVENKSLVERLRSFFTGTPTDGTNPDQSQPGTKTESPDGSAATLGPDMNNNYGYGNTPEDNFGYGNQFQDGNTTFGPQVNPQPTDERTTFERISDFVTSPFKSTPDNYGYGNPNQTEPYNLPPATAASQPSPDDPRLPAHYDPQDPLFNNVGPSPTPKELADLNRQTETAYVNQIKANLDQLESEFKPLDARASELKSELERLTAGAKQTDKGLIFKTQQEVDTYNATQEKFQKAVEDRNASAAKLNAAATDYNNMVEAYKVAPKFEYKSESGKYYDAFGGEYSSASQAVQADRHLLKNAELGNQYFAQEKVIEQFEKNNSWFSRTFDTETRKAYLAEEAKLAKLKDAIKTNTAVTNYLGKGPDAALFAERLNTEPTTQKELAVRSLLYGQAREWDHNNNLVQTMRTGSTEELIRNGYMPAGQDLGTVDRDQMRAELEKTYQWKTDLVAGRIAELTGAKEMTPQTLWSIATLTKNPEDFSAFNRAYLAGADTPMWQSILGEDRYHKWAGEVYAFGQTSVDKFVTDAYKDASERLTLTKPWQWGPGAASLLAGSIVGNVGEFVGLPTTQRSVDMLSQSEGYVAFSRAISGPMAFLDMTTLSAPKLAFTGTSLALREASLAAGEFRFGAGLTEGLSATEARVAARYAETVESNISGQVARGEMNPAAAQRAAYSELYEQIARSDPGRTGQVDNLMASLRSKMENLDITPPSGFRPQGATVADTAADVARAPDPVVTPKPGAPTEVSTIPRVETPVTNPSTVSPITNTARDAAGAVAREAAVAEALAEKAVTTQQAAAARTYEEAFAARTKAEEIQTKLNTQIARELESMAAQNVVRETDALRQLRQAAAEVQDLQTSLAKTMAREAVSSPPNISRSPYNEVVLSNKFGPLGRMQTLAANVFAESAMAVRNAFSTPAQGFRTAITAFQIQVGGVEAGNAGTNALENLYRASVGKNTLTLTADDAARLTNTAPSPVSQITSRISDGVTPVVNTAIPLSRFDATDILGNVNPFAQPTVIQNARGVGLTSDVPSGQQSFITYEGGKVVFNVRSLGEVVPSGTSYAIDLANLRVSAVRTVPESTIPNTAPAQVAPATAATTPAPTQAAPVTTARYGVPSFFTNGISNVANSVWNSINPISSARAATPRVGSEVTTPTAPSGSPVSARTTFYGPGASGQMQGPWATAKPNLEGETIVNAQGIRVPVPRTLDDVRLGKHGYVTIAVDSSNYGKFYNLGPVTYKSPLDKKIYTGDKLAAEASLKKADSNLHMTYAPQLEKVIGYAHNTGGAFVGRPDKFDVAVGDFRGWTGEDAMKFLTSAGQEYGGNKLNAWQQIQAVQARQYIAAVTAKPPAAVAEMTPKPTATKPVVETVRAANTATVPIVKKFTDRLTANLSRPVESVRAALTPRSIAVNPTSVAPQSPVETVIKNTKGEDIKVATDAKGDLQVNGKSYRELTDVDAIIAVDKQIIQPRLISELERLGHKVVVIPEPTGLPRSPFYIQKAAGELPVAPATNIVSHVALGDNAQNVIQGGLQPRFGQYLNASIYTDNCASGKCTVYIRDGLPRANHTARIDGRLPGAPDVFNWNSHGIELVARSETSVTAAGAQSVSDIAQAYRTAIGSDIRVVAHSDLNVRDDSVPGLKNIEGQRGKAQALTDLQNIPRVALQLPQSPQPLTSAPRRLAEGGNKEFEAYTDLSVQVGRDTLMRQGYIFAPAGIDTTKPVSIVMYMHGQLENGRSINAFSNTVERQQLAQQIRDSGMNAVLVAPNMDAIPAASGYFTRAEETTKFLAAAENQFAQTIGIPKESLQNSPVVLVTYSGGYYPAGKMLESGELNQRLSAILMLDSGYGTEAKGFLNGVKKWSQANPSGIVVSGYTVSTKAGNDALTNLFRNQRTGVLTRTIVTSPLPAGEVIKPGTFAQIRTQGTAAAPHRNYVTNAGLTTAGVQPPIATILQMLPSVSNPATPLVAQTKVPQVVKTMAERSIFAQPKSAAVQSDLGQVMAPTEAWMNARGREIVDAMGGSNGMLRPYTYDAAGVVRDLATGKVLEGFSFKPAGSAAARLDQIAKINGRPTNYKYNVVDGRLVALNELVRRSLGLQQLEFMSGVRPLDIGSNRHHTVVKGPDGTNMLITYAIDYAGGNTTIKAAIAAAASRAQTSLNAATGGKPFVPLSIGAQYPNTPNMVHMDVNPRPEARTWGGGQTSPLLSSIISFVARGSNTAENPVTHAVFAEALKQARLGISPTNPMVAIGGPTAPQVRQAPAIVAEAPDASLPTRPASQPSGMTERFTARITANGERVAEAATAMVKGAYENIRAALTPKTAPAPEVAVNADGDIRVTSPSTPNTHEMPTGVAPNPVTPAQPATPAGTPPVAQPAPVVTQPAAPVPTTPASTPVNADGDVRVTSPSTPNTHEMPAVAVVDSVPATQPVVSARVPFQEQVTTAASRAVDATRGWFDRSQKEFARLTEQLRARSAVQQSAQPAPNTIVGSDGDVIPVGQSSPNLHEMPTGVSAAKPVVSPSAAADTARIAREVAEGPASIDAAELARFAAIPPGPTKVTLAPTTKLTERVAETIRETTRPAVVVPSSEYHVALRSAADQLTKLRNAEAPLLKTLQDVTSQFSRTGNTDVLAAQLKAALPTYQEYDAVRKQTIAELQKLQKNPAVPAAEAKELGRTIGTLISRGSQIGNMLTESAFRSAVSLFDIHGSLSAHLTKVSVAAKVLNEAQRGSAGAIAHLAMAEETRLLAVMREAEKVAAAKPQTAAAVPTPAVSPAPTAPAPTAPVAAATDGSSFSLPKLISSVRENDVARPFFDTGVVLGAAGIALKATDVTARALKRATTAVANSWRAAFPRTASTPAAPATPARPTTPTAPTPTPTTPTTPTPSAPTPRAVLPSLGAMRSAASRASAALAPVARAAGVRAVAGTSAATKTVRNWVNARLARGNTTGTFAATPANPILRINPTNGRFEFIPPTTAGAAPTASLPGRFIQSAWGATKWCFSGFGKFTACALGGGAVYYFVVDPVMYAVSKDATAPAGTTQPQQNPNTQPKPGTQQPGTQQPGTQVPGTPGTTPGGETPDSGLGGLGGLGSLGNIAKSLPQLMQNLKNLFNPQQNTQPSTPTNIPTVKLDANPMTVVSGTTTRLSWSGENIANCTVIGPGSATLTRGGASGVITSPALATSTEFAVICSGTDGVSATNATVTVSVDGSSAPTIPVVLPPGVTKNASYSTAFNNPAGTTGSGTSAGTGSGNSTSGNGNNEAPVTPKTSGVDQYGNKVSAWCDPNQPIDSYTTCLCNLEPTGCYPWRQKQQ